MELQVGSEPMTLGSPTSPKAAHGAQFLPGFLMGDPPTPASPQPRAFGGTASLLESAVLKGGSSPQPVVPTPKDKSGAPPVRSIHDGPVTVATPLRTPHRQSFPSMSSPPSARQVSTPGLPTSLCLSPAQVDPFYSQGEALSSEDLLDQTWVTVFGSANIVFFSEETCSYFPTPILYVSHQFPASFGLLHLAAVCSVWKHPQARYGLSRQLDASSVPVETSGS